MKPARTRTVFRICAAVAVVVAMLGLAACGNESDEDQKSPAEQKVNETSVTLDRKTAAANAIVTVALEAAPASRTMEAGYATVVDLADLASSLGSYSEAIAQRSQAKARADASKAELARLMSLHADDQNASQKAVDAAKASAAEDDAAIASADAKAKAVERSMVQRWGEKLTREVLAGTSWSAELMNRTAVLVEAALTTDARPADVELVSPEGKTYSATFLAASPRVDPRLERPTLFYLAKGANLAIGLNLVVHADLAMPVRGVLVPTDAVVWEGGKSIVFVMREPGHYDDVAVDTSHPTAEGFVDGSLKPGERVVTKGAEQLLSQLEGPKRAESEDDD